MDDKQKSVDSLPVHEARIPENGARKAPAGAAKAVERVHTLYAGMPEAEVGTSLGVQSLQSLGLGLKVQKVRFINAVRKPATPMGVETHWFNGLEEYRYDVKYHPTTCVMSILKDDEVVLIPMSNVTFCQLA